MRTLLFLLLLCLAQSLKLDEIQRLFFDRHELLLEQSAIVKVLEDDRFVDFHVSLTIPPTYTAFPHPLDYGFFVRNRQNVILEFCRDLSHPRNLRRSLGSTARTPKVDLIGVFDYERAEISLQKPFSSKNAFPADAQVISKDGGGVLRVMEALRDGKWPAKLEKDVLRLLYNSEMSQSEFDATVSTDFFNETSQLNLIGCKEDGDDVRLELQGRVEFSLKSEVGPTYAIFYPPRILNATHYRSRKANAHDAVWFPGGKIENAKLLKVREAGEKGSISVVSHPTFADDSQDDFEVKFEETAEDGTVIRTFHDALWISTNQKSFTLQVNHAEPEIRSVERSIFLLEVPARFKLTIGNRTIRRMDEIKFDFTGELLNPLFKQAQHDAYPEYSREADLGVKLLLLCFGVVFCFVGLCYCCKDNDKT